MTMRLSLASFFAVILSLSVITRTDAGEANVLPNPGFEVVNSQNNLPAGWSPLGELSATPVTPDESVFRSGQRSVHFRFPLDEKAKNVASMTLVQGLPARFRAGETYTFSCYVKTRSLSGGASLYLFEYPAPIPADAQHITKPVSGDSDWTRVAITFKARPNISFVQVRLAATNNSSRNAGDVWFDDARIEKGSTPTDFTDGYQDEFYPFGGPAPAYFPLPLDFRPVAAVPTPFASPALPAAWQAPSTFFALLFPSVRLPAELQQRGNLPIDGLATAAVDYNGQLRIVSESIDILRSRLTPDTRVMVFDADGWKGLISEDRLDMLARVEAGMGLVIRDCLGKPDAPAMRAAIDQATPLNDNARNRPAIAPGVTGYQRGKGRVILVDRDIAGSTSGSNLRLLSNTFLRERAFDNQLRAVLAAGNVPLAIVNTRVTRPPSQGQPWAIDVGVEGLPARSLRVRLRPIVPLNPATFPVTRAEVIFETTIAVAGERTTLDLPVVAAGNYMIETSALDAQSKVIGWSLDTVNCDGSLRIWPAPTDDRRVNRDGSMTLQTTIENRDPTDVQTELTGRVIDTAGRELARLAPSKQTLKPGFNPISIPVKLVAPAQGVRVIAEIELSKGKLPLDRRSIDWSAEIFCRQPDYLFEYYMDVDFQMRDIGASGCVTISADEGITSLGLSPHPWIDSLPTGEIMGIMTPADALTRPSTQEKAAKNLARSLRAYRPYHPSTVIIQDEWSHAFRPVQADANLIYFRDYLRSRYANDVARLNQSWGTTLTSFDQVTLEMCTTEAIQKSAAPPTRWADLYRASEIAASDYIQLMSNVAQEAVPGAAVGLSGTQDTSATAGLDWWRIMRASGSSYTYGGSSVRQIQSFAQPGTKLFRWSYPTLSNTLRAARDPWRDMFDGCAGYVHYGGGYSELFGPDYRPHPVAPVVQQQIQEIRSGPARLLRGARLDDFGIATLYSPNSYRVWRYLSMTRGTPEFINDELISFSKAMADQRMNDIVVSYRQLETGEVTLPGYRALFLPAAAAMSDAEVQGVRKFVESGGLVIADLRPAMFDENCKERKTGPLDDVFGIAPATGAPALKSASLSTPQEFNIANKITVRAGEMDLLVQSDAAAMAAVQIDQAQAPAIVTHRFGKGVAVLLNFACPDYCRYRGGGYGGEVEIITQSASARGFDTLLASILRKHRDIQPWGDVLDTQGRRAPIDRLYTYQDEAAQYFAFLMPPGPAGEAQSNGVFQCRKQGWVYDVRRQQPLGRAGSTPLTMNFAHGALLAVLPYEVDCLAIKAPVRAAVGSTIELQLRVTARSGEVGRHVLLISIVRPDGSIQACDRFTVDAPGGIASARWSSALNDPTGAWKIRAIDAISGQSQESPLELVKP